MNSLDAYTLDVIRTTASAFTAVVALSALLIAVTQLVVNRRLQIDIRVKNLYAKFVEKSVDWAEVSSPLRHKIDWNLFTLDDCKIKFDKYVWYNSYMLDTCEEIFYLTEEKSWRSTIDYQIRLHREFFESDFFKKKNLIGMYRPEFATFAVQALRDGKKAGHA